MPTSLPGRTPLRFFALLAALTVVGMPLGGCAIAESVTGQIQMASRDAGGGTSAPSARPGEFRSYVAGLWPAAKARGVSRKTFDAAFEGVTPDPKIVALTKKQSEFVRPIWGYLDNAISASRLNRGREMAVRYASHLAAVERAYGVPRSVVLGVWGMETNFGSYTGSMDVIRSLATLAHIGYRDDFFEKELLTALQILEKDHITRTAMTGSWAGAMGQTQFMPSSYMKWAVDGDGDGRRDIWTSVPDALASTANYLKQHGWEAGQPWGVEVAVPKGFDFKAQRQTFAEWSRAGFRRAGTSGNLPGSGEAQLFLPAGASGPAFLVTANYDAIKAYNASDAYALGVAHLGDRLTGGGPLAGRWPTHEPTLDTDQRKELQSHLSLMGFYDGKADGKLGSQTREAVRQFQLRRGTVGLARVVARLRPAGIGRRRREILLQMRVALKIFGLRAHARPARRHDEQAGGQEQCRRSQSHGCRVALR